MNYTTYHKLQKPLSTEKYDIGVPNANADIIDSALNRLAQKDAEQANTLNNEIKRATERENEIDNKFSAISKATDQVDGLMSSEDKKKLDKITTGTGQANKIWKTNATGTPAWSDDISSSIETPVFDDSTGVYSALSAAATAAETASNAIKSNTSIFTTFSNMKKSFSAIVQGLKILAANVGAINGITSDINEESDNIAASIKVVNRLNSSLPKLHLAVVSGVSNNTGHFFIPNGDDGSIPIAAVPVSTGSYCNVLITTTGAYHAQITQWNDASIPLENVPVTLLVLYART